LTIWTIYHGPSDYPDSWVLRGHEVSQDRTQAHKVCFLASALNEVRAKVPPGSVCIGRDRDDHPVIYELWVASTDIDEIADLMGVWPASDSRERLMPEPEVGRLGQQARRHRSPEINCKNTGFVALGGLPAETEAAPGGNLLNPKWTIREMLDLEAELAMANRHVMEGEARVRRVRASIERRRQSGLNAELAENLLNTMRVSLSLMIDRKARIEADLA
jgi:hypothetical protein